jgi:hypothetical protein
MFGRDWRKEEDYIGITEYPPERQAWEYLRRKPTYQMDCSIVQAIDSWKKYLCNTDLGTFEKEVRHRHITGKALMKMIQNYGNSEKNLKPELKLAIIQLNVDEVKTLCLSRPVLWLLPRHDLNTWKNPLPPMPEEEYPKGLKHLFKCLEGGTLVTRTDRENTYTNVYLPVNHAALLINLDEPINPQLEGLAERLKTLQSKPKTRKKTFKKLHLYIRLLDADSERDEVETYRELFYFFNPDGYKRHDGSEKLERAANDYIGPRIDTAKQLRDFGYNDIANHYDPSHKFVTKL